MCWAFEKLISDVGTQKDVSTSGSESECRNVSSEALGAKLDSNLLLIHFNISKRRNLEVW